MDTNAPSPMPQVDQLNDSDSHPKIWKSLTLFIFLAFLFLILIEMKAKTSNASVTQLNTLTRTDDPVVLQGSFFPSFNNVVPGNIVGFRMVNGAWEQIPIQVDERAVVNLAVVYNSTPVAGVDFLNYTDPNTFTGADPNPNLDNDDEIVFMSKDAGDKPGEFTEPSGIVSNSGIEVTITDPLNPSQVGYAYIFKQSGNLDQGAGKNYVTYNFSLNSGNYKTTYNKDKGPNLENSSITSPYYSEHFSDRWLNDGRTISIGGASGADILDHQRVQFGPNECLRSEDTFDSAEGAFIVNKDGPVRAIRSYEGANSGPLSQRQHIFYERRQDVTTFLRVHEIAAIGDFVDYNPAATGMTYYNANNQGGLSIDGNPEGTLLNTMPEPPVAGYSPWELVTGPHGSVSYHHSYVSNMTNFSNWLKAYYLDDSTPPYNQCAGDNQSFGASGVWIEPRPSTIPCTDPRSASCKQLTISNIMYYDAPSMTVAGAITRDQQANNPLRTSVGAWQGQQPADTVSPTVSITAPTNGSTVLGNVPIAASASDNIGVVGVKFVIDGNNFGIEDITAPYGVTWNTASSINGPHSIIGVARDAAGNISSSTPVSVNVNNPPPDTTLPITAITNPTNGSTVTKHSNVTISANATDNVAVTKVETYIDGALRCTDTSAPYTCVWAVPNSRGIVFKLQTKAYDAANNIGVSTINSVTSK